MEAYSQAFLDKYQRMAKAGHHVTVIQQMASIDVQCDPNDSRLVQVTQYLVDNTQGLGGPVPLNALEDLLRTKYERMRGNGVSDDKMKIVEYYDKIATKTAVYDFQPELDGFGKLSDDRTIGNKEDPVFTESQLRANELKMEAFALKMAFVKMVVEDKGEEVDTAPLVESQKGHQEETGEIKTSIEFHSLKGKFPEPEILRNEVLEFGVVFREHIKDRLFTFLNVFTKVECDKLRVQLDFSEEETVEGELLKTAISSKHSPLVRTNIRRHFIDNQVSLVVWRIIKGCLPETLSDGRQLVGVRTKMNYYRYGTGHYFKTHIDGGFRFSSTGETSEYTFVIYLNDDFQGGTTRFCGLPEWNNEIREVAPVQGEMLVFRQHDTKHCGVTVDSGYKHILQGMVMYGPLRTNALGEPFGKEAQLFHTCEC